MAAGLTYGTPTVSEPININDPVHLDCAITSGSLVCQADGGAVALGANGSFTVSIPVTPHQNGRLTNPVGICQVDPEENILENVEDNNACASNQVNVTGLAIYLPLVIK